MRKSVLLITGVLAISIFAFADEAGIISVKFSSDSALLISARTELNAVNLLTYDLSARETKLVIAGAEAAAWGEIRQNGQLYFMSSTKISSPTPCIVSADGWQPVSRFLPHGTNIYASFPGCFLINDPNNARLLRTAPDFAEIEEVQLQDWLVPGRISPCFGSNRNLFIAQERSGGLALLQVKPLSLLQRFPFPEYTRISFYPGPAPDELLVIESTEGKRAIVYKVCFSGSWSCQEIADFSLPEDGVFWCTPTSFCWFNYKIGPIYVCEMQNNGRVKDQIVFPEPQGLAVAENGKYSVIWNRDTISVWQIFPRVKEKFCIRISNDEKPEILQVKPSL